MSRTEMGAHGSLPGRLFVFEGPDGVGKSALVQGLKSELEATGRRVAVFSFPGNEPGTLGHLIYRLHHEPTEFGVLPVPADSLQVMHVAAHLDCIQNRIVPALEDGAIVLLDRFWWSTVVYGRLAGVPDECLDAMVTLELTGWRGISPDALFLVAADPPHRLEADQRQCRLLQNEYSRLAVEMKGRWPIIQIDNSGTLADALAHTMESVEGCFAEERRKERGEEEADGGIRGSSNKAPPQDREHKQTGPTLLLSAWTPAKPTKVLDTYWRFAAERQNVFLRRLRGDEPPWTDDPILRGFKFTNAYRASDRVSQFLIRHVIHGTPGTMAESAEDLFFRIILFKTFNKIDTWRLIEERFGEVSWQDIDLKECDRLLTQAMEARRTIYSAAYIMPSGGRALGHRVKHRNHLELIRMMMADDVPGRIAKARSMREVFELLKSYPTIGDFLAYQYATDINYSSLTDFSEMSFVVPGPGAKDGLRKCFTDFGGLGEVDMIQRMADLQEAEFARLGIAFHSLWGRPLQLIDCQNCFCEVGKYARVAHPDVEGLSGRTRIKQRFSPHQGELVPFYPPNWRINSPMEEAIRQGLPGVTHCGEGNGNGSA